MADFRKILVAYINHVGEAEGVDFLPAELSDLTAEENAALARAAADGDCTESHRRDLIEFANKLAPEDR